MVSFRKGSEILKSELIILHKTDGKKTARNVELMQECTTVIDLK